MKDNMSDNFDINVKMPIWKSIKLRLFGVSNQRELLVRFIKYLNSPDALTFADDNNLIDNFLKHQ